MRPSSSHSPLSLIALIALAPLIALAACERDPRADVPTVKLVRASGATQLPEPTLGIDVHISPSAITVSDAHLLHALRDIPEQPAPAQTTNAAALRAGALADDSWTIKPLLDILTTQHERTRRLSALATDEPDAHSFIAPRVYIDPNTPFHTVLRVIYNTGQAAFIDPQLIVATEAGPRAIVVNTPRIGSPAAAAAPANDPLAALATADAPCQSVTAYLDSAGLTLTSRPSRIGQNVAQVDGIATPLAADLATLPEGCCPDLHFIAAPTLRWREVVPHLITARRAAPHGALYLATGER